MKQLSELIRNLWWSSETDALWELQTWNNLDKIDREKSRTIELDKFFNPVIQSQSWHDEEERKQVEQYRALLQWLKTNLTDLKVYRIGEVNIDLYIVGKSQDDKWVTLHTSAVET